MDRFIAKLNIEHFRKQIAEEKDESKRELLISLLAEEEAKLRRLDGAMSTKSGGS